MSLPRRSKPIARTTELKRSTKPIARGKPPARRSRIQAKRKPPEQAAAEEWVREAVFARDGGCLMARMEPDRCFGRLTFHHWLDKASAGGTYDASNGLALCVGHNGWVEDHPADARRRGLARGRGTTVNEVMAALAIWLNKRSWLRIAASLETNECIEWPWARTDGYGKVWWNGQVRLAHQVVMELDSRAAPDWSAREQTRHSCDNPPCVNRHHVVVGSYSENQLDRRRAGTDNGGERNGRTTLTQADAEAIRRRYEVRVTGPPMRTNSRQLAQEYGVSVQTIWRIVTDQTFTPKGQPT